MPITGHRFEPARLMIRPTMAKRILFVAQLDTSKPRKDSRMRFTIRALRQNDAWACPAIVWAALTLTGCEPAGPGSGQTVTPPDTVAHQEHGHEHGAHDHPSEGPHHGNLVELGNEEYHAEVVHGDAGAVSIYILDGSARNAVPIEAAEVVINLTHDGKPEQFKLAASPEAGEAAGKSSKFSITDQELAKRLDEEGAAAKLVVSISGKQYTGKIEHHHDHAHGHDHK
jgi:hypothetical protein